MYLHSSVSLNNEKVCHKISEDKIAVSEKTGFKLSLLGNASSRRNISDLRHAR